MAVLGAVALTATLVPLLPKAVPAAAAVDVEEYPVLTANGGPQMIAPGPDGNMWFTEWAGNAVGRVTPAGVVTEFPIPTANSGPQFITAGPDGNMWFTEYQANKIGRVNLTDNSITEFSVPTANSGPFGITAGPDGNVWFTEEKPAGYAIAKITPTGDVTEYKISGTFFARGADIVTGPDGNLWFTTQSGAVSEIGKITPAGVVSKVKTLRTGATGITIDAGPDGALWFTEFDDNMIGRITTGGDLSLYPVPTDRSQPWGIAAGPDGNLWFTEYGAGQIGRITPEGVVDEFAIPTSGSEPLEMAKGPDGRMWFVESKVHKIGAIATAATPLPSVHSLSPDQAPSMVETTVVISGVGLAGATAVTFGALPAASFTIDSDTQITAKTTLPGGFHDVTVETPVRTTPGVRFLSLAPLEVTSVSPAEGDPMGDDSVTIFGNGFASATAVSFGGMPAKSFSVGSDSQITAVTPAQPDQTVVHVLVTNIAGTSAATPSDLFTYLARPAVTSLSPQWGPAAGGTTVTINGSNFTNATSVSFGSQAVTCPDRCQVVSDTVMKVLSPPGAVGAVPVTVHTPNSGSSLAARLFAYTGDGAYLPTGSCAVACASVGAVLLPNGKVLGIGGGNNNVMKAHLFDPASGIWTHKSTCTGGSCGAGSNVSAVLLPSGPPTACGSNCGKVFIHMGGTFRFYDPATDVWSETSPSPIEPVHTDPVLLRDGKILLHSELNGTVYDPAAETWTPTGPLTARHGSGSATVLDDGRVLVTGGGGGGQSGPRVFVAEIYDPGTNTWSPTGELAQGRISHSAVRMADGKVLVTGGTVGFFLASTVAELYDPTTGEWSPAPSPIFARNSHTSTALPDGRVLLSGGDEPFSSSDGGVNSFSNNPSIGEVLDPATKTWLPVGPSISLQDRAQNNQEHVVRTVLLPPGPVSACGAHCGQVLTVRGHDIGALDIPLTPSAAFFAPSPRATLAPSSGTTAGGTVVTLTGTGLASVTAVSFGGVAAASVTPDPTTPDTKVTVVTPAHIAGLVDVAVTTAGGAVIAGEFTFQSPAPPPNPNPNPTPNPVPTPVVPGGPGPAGYAMAAADGGVFAFGGLPFAGSLGGMRLNQPIVAMEHTPTGKGYWLAGADGGVFAFGDAGFKGSTGGIRLAKPIVDIVGTPSGNGYFLIGSDGGVFAFGDAAFKGSTGALKLNSSIVAAERSSTGNGYWLVGADGGVFAFGDAAFKGSTGAIKLAQPVVSGARSAGGAGYWLVAADGGVFAFGDAVFHGSTGALKLNSPIVGAAAPATGSGYVLCARDGGAFAFGAAPFAGSMGASRLNSPIVGCSGPRPAAT